MDYFSANVFSGKSIGGGVATDHDQIAIPEDDHRKFLGIFNNDADNVMWLNFGAPAVAGQGVPIYPRDGYELKQTDITLDDVHIIMANGLTGSYSYLVGG